ncbi:MAG: class I mannose-6-phosphate isomerase [Lentisphaeria bacterium]|nr:class I mannose-6-phosphate isomerase [Lentisphaeria bacterium]
MPKPNIPDLPPFFRILPNRVWRTYLGGKTLDDLSGISPAADSHFPEEWLLSDTAAVNPGREPEGISKLELDGREVSFTALAGLAPEYLFGPAHLGRFGRKAGFLLKFLDSSVRLHMQCHPTREFSRRHLGADAGKTEGYIILGCREGVEPYLYLGFQRAVSRERFKTLVEAQDTEEMLKLFERIPVRTGDVFLVPGGMPHAIGEGIFMIEIMEPTDFVVRFEFDRGGYVLPENARFMGRGIDFALSMLDFTPYPAEEVRERFFIRPQPKSDVGGCRREALFAGENARCFRADRIRVSGRAAVANEDLSVLVVTGGNGTLCAGAARTGLSWGDRILIPHGVREFTLDGSSLEAVLVMPPAPEA